MNALIESQHSRDFFAASFFYCAKLFSNINLPNETHFQRTPSLLHFSLLKKSLKYELPLQRASTRRIFCCFIFCCAVGIRVFFFLHFLTLQNSFRFKYSTGGDCQFVTSFSCWSTAVFLCTKIPSSNWICRKNSLILLIYKLFKRDDIMQKKLYIQDLRNTFVCLKSCLKTREWQYFQLNQR